MAETTAIEWCDATWSPVWGCTQVSPACDNCYAMTLAHRFGHGWNGEPMREFADAHWRLPLRWNRKAGVNREQWRVFPSMCDPFDKDWPAGTRLRFLDLIRTTPNLTWLLLTKRIGNWRSQLEAIVADLQSIDGALQPEERATLEWIQRWLAGDAPANVWLGITVINQAEADRDVPKLLNVPARIRFLSIEPMLGPVSLHVTGIDGITVDALTGAPLQGWRAAFPAPLHRARVDWVIVGGESGPKARPMHPDWPRSLRDQCAAAGVPFMFKQHGEWVSPGEPAFGREHGRAVTLVRPSGEQVDPSSPEGRDEDIDAMTMSFVGKKAAGRLLDGVTHDGVPT